MNTAAQPAVTDAQLEEWVRAWYRAQAGAVIIPVLPPRKRGRRERLAAWRRARATMPVSTWGVGLCYALGAATVLVLLELIVRRYGIHTGWERFAGSWPA